jgi:predicted DNA-binding transcriptional regulator YafY
MRRSERLYALVDLLRGSRRPFSATRLSEEFEVSKRTIERDIQSLQLAGVPIYADYGVSGGYSILREHSLPPLNLTVPESLAVLAGLGLLETAPYGAAARRARAKVLAISREDQLAPVDEALASIAIRGGDLADSRGDRRAPGHTAGLHLRGRRDPHHRVVGSLARLGVAGALRSVAHSDPVTVLQNVVH